MSDVAFEQYAQQIDFLQVFQLEILQKKNCGYFKLSERK